MKELTTQTGIIVKCSKTAIEFSKMLNQWISSLHWKFRRNSKT